MGGNGHPTRNYGGVGGKGNSGRGGNRKCEGVCIRYILYALFK